MLALAVCCVVLVGLGAACGGGVAAGADDALDQELSSRGALFANDVSILFSLPRGRDQDLLLAPSARGAKGELLPQATFDALPRLVPEGATRDELRVVSVRVDPCFPGLEAGPTRPTPEASCKNQIRIVLQPIDASEADETVRAKDAAVHVFYTMDRAELADVAREILAAKHGAPGSLRAALGVHPLVERQGLRGTFATEVKAAVLRHAGKSNLTRVTFLTREPPRQPLWRFGGFDVDGSRRTKMRIATLGAATSQTFATLVRNGTATPAPRVADDISLLFRASVAATAPREELERAYVATLAIQNPTRHSPDTVDCVSCHVATSARIWAERNAGQSPAGNEAAYSARFNTKLTKSPAAERADNLHSFGYLGTEVSISHRTANESAAVAEYVNAEILGQR